MNQSSGCSTKATAWVLVEAHDHPDLECARLDRVVGSDERRPSGGAAVADVGERDPRGTELSDHRVRLTTVGAATDSELDIPPFQARIGHRAADRCRFPSRAR